MRISQRGISRSFAPDEGDVRTSRAPSASARTTYGLPGAGTDGHLPPSASWQWGQGRPARRTAGPRAPSPREALRASSRGRIPRVQVLHRRFSRRPGRNGPMIPRGMRALQLEVRCRKHPPHPANGGGGHCHGPATTIRSDQARLGGRADSGSDVTVASRVRRRDTDHPRRERSRSRRWLQSLRSIAQELPRRSSGADRRHIGGGHGAVLGPHPDHWPEVLHRTDPRGRPCQPQRRVGGPPPTVRGLRQDSVQGVNGTLSGPGRLRCPSIDRSG